MESFIQRYADKIIGQVSGWDRVRFRGTVLLLANAAGLGKFLACTRRWLKDFKHHALDLSQRVRQASLQVAAEAGRPVVYLQDPGVCKEDLAREIQARDRIRKGLICILTAVEPCWSYNVRYNPATGWLELVRAYRKCLHLYHYQIHPEFGFLHARLQTWLPFTQFICLNGREWLSRQMDRAHLRYVRAENCFAWISDPEAAQRLLDRQVRWDWPTALGRIGAATNPALPAITRPHPLAYYWSAEASEWASDLMFHDQTDLAALHPLLLRHGLETFGCRDVLRFLGRRVDRQGICPRLALEVVSDVKQRPEGIRLKHRVGANSVKLYDKQGTVLRVETTLNNMRELKSPRKRNGRLVWRPMRKGVADMARRARVSAAVNRRYLQALAAVHTTVPLKALTEALALPVVQGQRRARGLNLLGPHDARLLEIVGRGEFLLAGFRNRDLRQAWFPAPAATPAEQRRQSGQITRKIALLRAHGLVAKVSKTHRYLVTHKGRQVIAALNAARAADIEKLTQAA